MEPESDLTPMEIAALRALVRMPPRPPADVEYREDRVGAHDRVTEALMELAVGSTDPTHVAVIKRDVWTMLCAPYAALEAVVSARSVV